MIYNSIGSLLYKKQNFKKNKVIGYLANTKDK